MNKKLTVFSIILIIVGIIGSIYSGIASIPYFIDTYNKVEAEFNKEHIIYNKNIDINNLDISTLNDSTVIKQYNGNDIKIVVKGIYNENKYEVKEETKTIKLIEKNIEKERRYKIKKVKDLLDMAIENSMQEHNSVIIYVPNKVNINASTNYGELIIEDDILLNEVNLKTMNGYISLPRDIKSLDRLNIVSNGNIRLSMTELLGIKDVYIDANYIEIYSSDDDIFIEDIEKFIPNNINIISSNNNNIDINTNIPISKNLNIDSIYSDINLDIPIDRYKFKFNMRAHQIDLYNIKDRYNINNDLYQSKELKEIKGILNKELESLDKEYYINIKANNINM